ncbi:hypothetical protein CDAR_477221 [Caerostris darwini]|uniref:Uncharacterized protein n=1 Tax=Caerostris darwini TaxID=1538125 RepID=A0AAV4TVV9_9ARAC|nr:hypothetical protein CDAR_477221 [Caerostris darwini]
MNCIRQRFVLRGIGMKRACSLSGTTLISCATAEVTDKKKKSPRTKKGKKWRHVFIVRLLSNHRIRTCSFSSNLIGFFSREQAYDVRKRLNLKEYLFWRVIGLNFLAYWN